MLKWRRVLVTGIHIKFQLSERSADSTFNVIIVVTQRKWILAWCTIVLYVVSVKIFVERPIHKASALNGEAALFKLEIDCAFLTLAKKAIEWSLGRKIVKDNLILAVICPCIHSGEWLPQLVLKLIIGQWSWSKLLTLAIKKINWIITGDSEPPRSPCITALPAWRN